MREKLERTRQNLQSLNNYLVQAFGRFKLFWSSWLSDNRKKSELKTQLKLAISYAPPELRDSLKLLFRPILGFWVRIPANNSPHNLLAFKHLFTLAKENLSVAHVLLSTKSDYFHFISAEQQIIFACSKVALVSDSEDLEEIQAYQLVLESLNEIETIVKKAGVDLRSPGTALFMDEAFFELGERYEEEALQYPINTADYLNSLKEAVKYYARVSSRSPHYEQSQLKTDFIYKYSLSEQSQEALFYAVQNSESGSRLSSTLEELEDEEPSTGSLTPVDYNPDKLTKRSFFMAEDAKQETAKQEIEAEVKGLSNMTQCKIEIKAIIDKHLPSLREKSNKLIWKGVGAIALQRKKQLDDLSERVGESKDYSNLLLECANIISTGKSFTPSLWETPGKRTTPRTLLAELKAVKEKHEPKAKGRVTIDSTTADLLHNGLKTRYGNCTLHDGLHRLLTDLTELDSLKATVNSQGETIKTQGALVKEQGERIDRLESLLLGKISPKEEKSRTLDKISARSDFFAGKGDSITVPRSVTPDYGGTPLMVTGTPHSDDGWGEEQPGSSR